MKENRSSQARAERDEATRKSFGSKVRNPKLWGTWLTHRMGLQRQMLDAMQNKPMFTGIHTEQQRKNIAHRRAKNKVARKQRIYNARRGRK